MLLICKQECFLFTEYQQNFDLATSNQNFADIQYNNTSSNNKNIILKNISGTI